MYTLALLSDTLAVCRLEAQAPFPEWAQGELVALMRSVDELSVVCTAGAVPAGVQAEPDWRALRVQGPLDFSLVGVLAELSNVLADAGVSIFAISTYDTDYLLVKASTLEKAVRALQAAGHVVERPGAWVDNISIL
ncbi:MAG: ACT domain-containing protein [Chloroflexota bacterium]